MKILLPKGIHPPKDGTILPCQGPIQACAEFNPTASHVRLSEAKLDYCVHT